MTQQEHLQELYSPLAFQSEHRPGDREKVIWLLKSHFDNVFEVPV